MKEKKKKEKDETVSFPYLSVYSPPYSLFLWDLVWQACGILR